MGNGSRLPNRREREREREREGGGGEERGSLYILVEVECPQTDKMDRGRERKMKGVANDTSWLRWSVCGMLVKGSNKTQQGKNSV